MPPHHVQSTQDYWLWLDKLIGQSSGYLDGSSYLDVQTLEDLNGEPDGLLIEKQRLRFHDRTFLDFRLHLDEDLNCLWYSYHFQHDGGPFIWRKDRHPGHENEVGEEHVHADPADENAREKFDYVELDEVLTQVAAHQATSGQTPS